jgi:hypothetical protein
MGGGAVRTTPTAEKILIEKSKLTGVKRTKLVEYALVNMPPIDRKSLKNKRK